MDPAIGASLISGGASLLGGLFGNNSAKKAANRQMDFQREMAMKSHQYEVADLRAAGLNPILSAGGSGAAVPSGAMPSLNQNVVGDAINSALAVKMQKAQIDNIEQDTKVKKQTEGLVNDQSQKTIWETLQAQMSARLIENQAKSVGFDNVSKALEANIMTGASGEAIKMLEKLGVGADSIKRMGSLLNLKGK